MPTDWSYLREVNPELADDIEASTNPPKPPQGAYELMNELYPNLAAYLDSLPLPTGGAGLFPASFPHSKIGADGDEDLQFFDPETLANMPRAGGPGEAQIADRKGRLHDVYTLQVKLDKAKGIQYSAGVNPATTNRLLGGS